MSILPPCQDPILDSTLHWVLLSPRPRLFGDTSPYTLAAFCDLDSFEAFFRIFLSLELSEIVLIIGRVLEVLEKKTTEFVQTWVRLYCLLSSLLILPYGSLLIFFKQQSTLFPWKIICQCILRSVIKCMCVCPRVCTYFCWIPRVTQQP